MIRCLLSYCLEMQKKNLSISLRYVFYTLKIKQLSLQKLFRTGLRLQQGYNTIMLTIYNTGQTPVYACVCVRARARACVCVCV